MAQTKTETREETAERGRKIARDRATREAVISPIDRAMAAKNRPGQMPIDAVIAQRQREREMPAAPMSWSPGQLDEADPARPAIASLHGMWSAIKDASADHTVSVTELGSLGQRALEKSLRQVDQAVSGLDRQIDALEKKIDSTIMPEVPGPLATEIRQTVKAMFTDRAGKSTAGAGRVTELTKACREDMRVASAILSAPQLLTGLKPEFTDAFRRDIINEHCPETRDRIASLKKSREFLEAASNRAIEDLAPRLNRWQQPDNPAVAALKRGAA